MVLVVDLIFDNIVKLAYTDTFLFLWMFIYYLSIFLKFEGFSLASGGEKHIERTARWI